MEIAARLAYNVKRLRKAKGLSQEELAHLAGVHRTYASDIERAVRTPTITIVDRFAKALDVSAGTLLD